MSTGAEKRYTVDQYLALERQSDIKHEYFDGEIFAMAGGSRPHSLVGANCIRELGNALKGRSCEVHTSDMQVFCPTGLRTYPDASVVCGEAELEAGADVTLLNPLVIVEVLSKTTEAYDRGRKFEHYKTIESLQEYVLIAQDRPQVDHFARQATGSPNPTGQWLLTTFTELDAALELPALECQIPLAEIYLGAKFEE